MRQLSFEIFEISKYILFVYCIHFLIQTIIEFTFKLKNRKVLRSDRLND